LAYEVPDFAAQVSIIASEVTLSVAVSGTANVNISGQSIDVKITNAVDATGAPIPLKIDISAQSVGNLGVDIKAQTVGNIKVDLAAQSIATIGVDIKAQSIGNINVNIASSSVTLNVNIASQSTTLNVNISSQSANVNISVAAQSVGVYLEPQWAAKQGTDVDVQGVASTVAGSENEALICSYDVPAGKTLLIYNYGAASDDDHLYPATIWIYNSTDRIVLSCAGGAGGAGIALTKPIRVGAGKHVCLYMRCYVYSAGKYFRGSFHGELI